ncbi:MAG TPA: hypothetical protein VEX66_05210 [Microlunatus sp.]|nr:hypothetical protein [Microlunatus sp.]
MGPIPAAWVASGASARVQVRDEQVKGSRPRARRTGVVRPCCGVDEEPADVPELAVGVARPTAQQPERSVRVDAEPTYQDPFGLLDDRHRLQLALQVLIVGQHLIGAVTAL